MTHSSDRDGFRKRSLRDPSHTVDPSLLRCRGWHAIRKPSPSEKRSRRSVGSIAALVVGLLVLAAAVYVMVNGLGLNPDLDFGAGAYYYADIPDYQKTLDWDVYTARLPFWVYLLLFLLWGWIIWKVWKKMD